jgi:hypothetical protein
MPCMTMVNEDFLQLAVFSNAQKQAFHSKCVKMALAFSRCQLSKTDTIQGYRSILLPRLRYGLSATNISKKNLIRSQQIVTQCILPKLGYNRHMPTAVVYAPSHFGGIGLSDMTTEQGLAHVMFLIGHIRAKSDIADTITTLLETYMVATGTTTNPLQDHQQHKYVQAPWVENIKEFLHQTNTTVETPNIRRPILIRQHDQAIMHVATKHQFSKHQLLHINACRIWLQVTTIAEITNIQGNTLLHPATTGEIDQTGRPSLWKISTSKLTWPQQPNPSKQSWRQWKLLINKITQPRSPELAKPLGAWYQCWDSQRKWNFAANKSHTTISHTDSNMNTVYYNIRRRTTSIFQTYTKTTSPENDITYHHPVTPSAINHDNIVVLASTRPAPIQTPTATTHRTNIIQEPRQHIPRQLEIHDAILCVHTTHAYEQQNFTWSIQIASSNIHIKGEAHYLQSRHCSSIRGGLISIFQALNILKDTLNAPRPKQIRLLICSKDSKLLSAIKPKQHSYRTARHMLAPEHDLRDTINTKFDKF